MATNTHIANTNSFQRQKVTVRNYYERQNQQRWRKSPYSTWQMHNFDAHTLFGFFLNFILLYNTIVTIYVVFFLRMIALTTVYLFT